MRSSCPKPGYYALLSDFLPSGGSTQFLTRPLVTAGYTGDLMAQSAQLVPDTSADADRRRPDRDGLATTRDVMRAGSYSHITFHLTNRHGAAGHASSRRISARSATC